MFLLIAFGFVNNCLNVEIELVLCLLLY